MNYLTQINPPKKYFFNKKRPLKFLFFEFYTYLGHFPTKVNPFILKNG